jgi:predicted XRE-type DNA-binding protein
MSWAEIDDGQYLVYDDGRVASTTTGRYLKPGLSRGYHSVQLSNRRRVTVHKLVAEAFIGPRPDGCQVNHKNGIKTDNRVENLEYVTRSENMKHAHRLGLKSNKGEKHSRHKLTGAEIEQIRALLASEVAQKAIAEMFSVDPSHVSHIKRGKVWSHLSGSA